MRPAAPKTWLSTAFAILAGAAAACTDQSQITAPAGNGPGQGQSLNGSGDAINGNSLSSSSSSSSATGSGASSGISSDGSVKSSAVAGGAIGNKVTSIAPVAPIVYPTLALTGSGVTTCAGSFYPTTSQFTSTMDAKTLTLNLTAAQITADSDKVTQQANQQIQQNLGASVYTRVAQDQVQKLSLPDYAVFATSVTQATQGQSFTFDAPLPVFPWPAPAAVYSDLVASGSKSWSANVTGSINSPVTVTLQKVGGDDVTQLIQFTTTIANDTDRSLYQVFPLPRQVTYTVNSQTQDVREVNQLSWFFGKDNCDDGEEQITIDYKLCSKTLSGQTTQYSCQ